MALCTDCDARSVYLSDGRTDYPITFEYEENRPYLINVAVRAPETTEYTEIPTEDPTYPWSIGPNPDGVTSTQVRFTATVPPVGYEVIIYRCTDVDKELAHFQPGHPIKAADLENNFSILGDAIEEIDAMNGGQIQQRREEEALRRQASREADVDNILQYAR